MRIFPPSLFKWPKSNCGEAGNLVFENISAHLNLKEENKKLKMVIENYKSLDLNLEYLTNENENLRKILDAENITNDAKNVVLAKVLVDRNSPFLKSIIINKGTQSGIKKGICGITMYMRRESTLCLS